MMNRGTPISGKLHIIYDNYIMVITDITIIYIYICIYIYISMNMITNEYSLEKSMIASGLWYSTNMRRNINIHGNINGIMGKIIVK